MQRIQVTVNVSSNMALQRTRCDIGAQAGVLER